MKRNPLIVALDIPTAAEALALLPAKDPATAIAAPGLIIGRVLPRGDSPIIVL